MRDNSGEPAAREASARYADAMPRVSPFLARGFNRYVPRYLRKHFNAVRVSVDSIPDTSAAGACICFTNHPSWWDPLLAFLLNQRYLSGRTVYIPIDAAAMAKYPIFGKLGFYGLDLDTLQGAKRFLHTTRELLKQPQTAIWMSPGGRFVDVRERTEFQPGLGHIAATVPDVSLLPVAFEYCFWQERTAEALVQFGQPVRSDGCGTKASWQQELETRLADAQASLAKKAVLRNPDRFETVVQGRAGVGGMYDLFRRLRSYFTATRFDPRHVSPRSAR